MEECASNQEVREKSTLNFKLEESLGRFSELVDKSHKIVLNRDDIFRRVDEINEKINQLCCSILDQNLKVKLEKHNLTENLRRTLRIQ